LRTVIKSNPEFVPAYDALAECLARPGPHQKLEEAHWMTLAAVGGEPGNVQYRIRTVEVLERMGRAEDAIKVATIAVSMARTPEEQGAASAALAGARQFQVSQQKMKELAEGQKSDALKNEAQNNDEQKPLVLAASANKDPKARGSLAQGQGPLEVLTDTMGVDFNPYLARVLHDVKQSWYSLIPESAQWKKGRVVLEFYILKDGSVAGLKVVGSSGDAYLDRPAYGSIVGANPLPPLPKEFPGPYLGLRFSFYYNLNTDGSELGQKKTPSLERECTAEDYLTSFLSSDDSASVSIWPPSPVTISLNKHQKFIAGGGTTHLAFADWAVTGELCKIADCGSVSPMGLYAAPATMPPSPDIVVTVTETRKPCRSGSVNLTLVPAQALP
jgi:TonB family protein